MPRARAATLGTLANALLAEPRLLRRGQVLDELLRNLCQLKGIGPWSAHYLALRQAGAADAYAAWARALAGRWADTLVVCAAHSAVRKLPEGGFAREIEAALGKVSRTLDRHRARYG